MFFGLLHHRGALLTQRVVHEDPGSFLAANDVNKWEQVSAGIIPKNSKQDEYEMGPL